jgi:hypothetical protein
MKTKTQLLSWCLWGSLSLMLAASSLRADEAPATESEANADAALEAETQPAPDKKAVGVDVALKVGGTFHTLFNGLSPFVILELEGGILLLDEHLQLDLAVGWAQPPASSAADDPRFEAGDYDWKLRQDFFTFAILARYRFLDRGKLFNFYAGLGPKLFLLRSVATGSAGGEDFGETRQYETRFGGVVVLGPELHLGPGALGLELAFGFGNLDGLLTGDASTTALDVLLGYRLMF